MGYDIVEDIKKTKANIYLFELCNLPEQRNKLLEYFDPQPSSTSEAIESNTEINEISIGGKSKSQTLTLLLTFEIFNHNVHNCLVDSRASSNVMPLSICKNINGQPTPSPSKIIQLDRCDVKVIGEMKDVLIRLSVDPRVCQFIDIMVVDILEAYSLILSTDWSTKINGYFATDWSHICLPYQNIHNKIKLLREPHMKQNVTWLEGNNEPINFSSSVLGN